MCMLLQCTWGERRDTVRAESPEGARAAPTLASEPSQGGSLSHLHGLEGPQPVKLKLHLHIATGEAMVTPSHIIIAWPNSQFLALPKVIQPYHTICQLAQTTILQPGEEGTKEGKVGRKEVINYPGALHIHPSGLVGLAPIHSSHSHTTKPLATLSSLTTHHTRPSQILCRSHTAQRHHL